MVPAPSGPHADLAHQLAVLLDGPARDAGLFPTLHEFNLGESRNDFRVPDGGVHRERLTGMWHPTTALVVEIISPGDETRAKLPFYAAHKVDEALIVDPDARTVEWLALRDGEYVATHRSALMELGPTELAQRLDWPDA